MGSARGWHPDTCRRTVRATVAPTNCGVPVLPCLLGLRRPRAVKAAWYNSALTAIGSGLGKRKRRLDLLPAHGCPWYRSGSCSSAPAVAFRRCMACERWKHSVFQVPFDAQRRSLARPAADGGASWPRRCRQGAKARHRKYDMRARISGVMTVDARLCLRMSQTVCQRRRFRLAGQRDRRWRRMWSCCSRAAHMGVAWPRPFRTMTMLEALGREAGGLNIPRGGYLHPGEVGQEGPGPLKPAKHLDVRFRGEIR